MSFGMRMKRSFASLVVKNELRIYGNPCEPREKNQCNEEQYQLTYGFALQRRQWSNGIPVDAVVSWVYFMTLRINHS